MADLPPPITGIYCCATSGANAGTVPERYKGHFISFEQNADAPMQTIEVYEFIQSKHATRRAVHPPCELGNAPLLITMFLATLENYKPGPRCPRAFPVAMPVPSVMPRTYFQACGWDIMRDCTLVMEQVLRDGGVPTRLDVYPGMPHAFWALGLPITQARKFETDTLAGLRWLLR